MAKLAAPTGGGAVTFKGIGTANRLRAPGLAQQTAVARQPSSWATVDHPVTDAPEARISVMNDVLKPYLLLACVAFVLGFASYLAMGSFLMTSAQVQDDWQASISVPNEPSLAPTHGNPGKLI